MNPRRLLRAPALPAAVALLLAPGCGVSSRGGGEVAGQTLTIYSSLPLRGEQGALSRDLVDAEKLALQDSGARVGPYSVQYVSLNDAPGSAPRAVPAVVAANARKAVRDPSAIAFLGNLSGAASEISIPIINAAGYLQVNPVVPLAPVAAPRLYPAGRHTLISLAPGAAQRAAALAGAARTERLHRVTIAGPAGREARLLTGALAGVGIRAQGPGTASPATGAVVVVGTPGEAAAAARRALAARPGVSVLAGGALAVPSFFRALGPAASRTRVAMAVPADPAPGPFARRFAAVFGRTPDPRAAYGYAAMRLVVSSLRGAMPHAARRRSVIDQALSQAGGSGGTAVGRTVDIIPAQRLAGSRS